MYIYKQTRKKDMSIKILSASKVNTFKIRFKRTIQEIIDYSPTKTYKKRESTEETATETGI